MTNNITGFIAPVTQSNDSHSGNYSVKMEMMAAMSALLQPVITVGEYGYGIPVSQRYSTISFYYKYFPTTSTVSLTISVGMYKNNQLIGVAVGTTKAGSGSYKKMTSTINYSGQQIPDLATIYVTLIDSLFNPSSVGSYAIVDDFYFDQLIQINDEKSDNFGFSLDQNYPNSFNSTTKISWHSPVSGWQSLKVYNILGVEVATLVNENKPSGSYSIQFDAKALPGGVYFYKIQMKGYSAVKKMSLLK